MPRREKPVEPEDDGRSFADMNVEGMPWYVPKTEQDRGASRPGTEMTPRERRAYIWAAVRSALLIGGAYAVVFAAFILFCIHIWFR